MYFIERLDAVATPLGKACFGPIESEATAIDIAKKMVRLGGEVRIYGPAGVAKTVRNSGPTVE